MPDTPDPLDATDCPLLARYPDRLAPVLADYNAAAATARTLLEKFPKATDDPEAAESLGRLADARRALTTARYKVGFLGPFQCGKSTILNNLLGQEVSGVGVGKACTSVVTRLIPDLPERPARMTLTYFTTDKYKARRDTLCEWLQLPNQGGTPEAQLVETLKTHVVNPSAPHYLPKDKPFLRAFLQSFAAYGKDKVRSPRPHTETFDWAPEKRKLLTHTGDDDDNVSASPYLLVAESTVSFPTDRVDPELELVDCPGLGSGRSVDDLLTTEYVKELDGALVFLRADSMDSREVGKILAALQYRFRDALKARVWVVVNKMDAPEQHAKVGGPDRVTTWDVIIDLMARAKIPLSQVCLSCNGIFRAAAQTGGTADRTTALNILQLFGPGDDAAVKARLAATPELAAAYEELLKDGGVSRLARLIRETMRPSVAGEILAEAAATARQTRSELEYLLQRWVVPVSAQEKRDTVAWENALVVALAQLSGAWSENHQPPGRGKLFTILEGHGRKARAALLERFKTATPEAVLAHMPTAELFDRFGIDAAQLQDDVDAEFDRVAQAAYDAVTEQLVAAALPRIELPDGTEPMAAWAAAKQDDKRPGGWRDEQRPRLAGDGFAGRMQDGSLKYRFSPQAYQKLFHGRLRTAAQQITLAVRGQLRARLDAIRKQVRRKLGPTDKAALAAAPAAPRG